MAKEITVTAEQIAKLIAAAEKQASKAGEYYGKGHNQSAARREGIALGIYHALEAIGVEID